MFILASASPRRKELLEEAGFEFKILPSDIDEDKVIAKDARALAVTLAELKAKKISENQNELVLGADTVVVLRENGKEELFGKPNDAVDAVRMLTRLQGRSHSVITGFSLVRSRQVLVSSAVETTVKMKALSEDEILKYVQTQEPLDKAGAYAIQGLAKEFIESISGSYSNVVGLPVDEVVSALEKLGIKPNN
jgi:septum formation protein